VADKALARSANLDDLQVTWLFGALKLMCSMGHEVAGGLLACNVLERVLLPQLEHETVELRTVVIEAIALLCAEEQCRSVLLCHAENRTSCCATLLQLLVARSSPVRLLRAVSSIFLRCSSVANNRHILCQHDAIAEFLKVLGQCEQYTSDSVVRLNLVKAFECLLFEVEAKQSFVENDGIALLVRLLRSATQPTTTGAVSSPSMAEFFATAHWILCKLAHDGMRQRTLQSENNTLIH
jgi:hypothetical protein